MIINGIAFHIIPTIIKKKISPGVFTSIILFLPLSLLTIYEINKTNKLKKEIIITAFVAGSIIMAYPIILNRIKNMLKNKQ
jgi:hypothetical protein